MRVFGIVGRGVLALLVGALVVLAAARLLDDRHVGRVWRELEREPESDAVFQEEMVAGLPDPARRYFLHTIQPGTPLATRLRWRYSGSLRLGEGKPWMPLRAEQIVGRLRGFVWKATVGRLPMVFTGADHYLDGAGRMRISLFGLLPVVNAGGPDISRSALGRLLIESATLPSSILPGPHVQFEGIDDAHFRVIVDLDGERTPLTFTVDEEGRLMEMVMQRWGDQTDDHSFAYIPYGFKAEAERTFGGYTIPSQMRVGWWFGTERYVEVIRLTIDEARLN